MLLSEVPVLDQYCVYLWNSSEEGAGCTQRPMFHSLNGRGDSITNTLRMAGDSRSVLSLVVLAEFNVSLYAFVMRLTTHECLFIKNNTLGEALYP